MVSVWSKIMWKGKQIWNRLFVTGQPWSIPMAESVREAARDSLEVEVVRVGRREGGRMREE